MKVLLDTSVLVASLVSAHPHHRRALPIVQGVVQGRVEGCVAAHGLAETYAVLTTLPVSPRIGPESALRLVGENVAGHFEAVALSAREYARLIATLPERGVLGGAVYDAIHAECARKAGVARLYTFDVPDFRRVAPDLVDRITAP